MTNKRKIIDRIEKLYALASGGTSRGEAEAAIQMAQKLAKKYNIHDHEINKETYTKGTSTKSKPESKSHSYQGFWKDYEKRWNEDARRNQDFRREYNKYTFEPKFVKADLISETQKAYLINVYLDETKYPWSNVPVITVRIWFPKSQVTTYISNIWLLNENLLQQNLKNNIPWLRNHHPVFRGRTEDIVFHLKSVV